MTAPRKARITPIRPTIAARPAPPATAARIAGGLLSVAVIALLGSLVLWGLVEVWQGILG